MDRFLHLLGVQDWFSGETKGQARRRSDESALRLESVLPGPGHPAKGVRSAQSVTDFLEVCSVSRPCVAPIPQQGMKRVLDGDPSHRAPASPMQSPTAQECIDATWDLMGAAREAKQTQIVGPGYGRPRASFCRSVTTELYCVITLPTNAATAATSGLSGVSSTRSISTIPDSIAT